MSHRIIITGIWYTGTYTFIPTISGKVECLSWGIERESKKWTVISSTDIRVFNMSKVAGIIVLYDSSIDSMRHASGAINAIHDENFIGQVVMCKTNGPIDTDDPFLDKNLPMFVIDVFNLTDCIGVIDYIIDRTDNRDDV